MIKPSFAFAAMLALSACQQRSAEENFAIDDSANVANADIETLPPSDATGPPAGVVTGDISDEAENSAADTRSATIPAQYHGRWGMVASDCTSTRGDAKGLITISDTSIRFYESIATLVEQRPAIATGFAGFYRFTGEGQEWEKIVTLKRSGDRLTRADDRGNVNYRRC